MNTRVKIEVDERTAALLEARACELGVSVSELLAELADRESSPAEVDAEELAELDRRWSKVEAGAATVPNDEVVRWLQTWGTPGFRRWQDR
jgi:hypothetical protein